MDYGSTLPRTGGGIVVGGVLITQGQMALLALALILLGVLLVVAFFRRGKQVSD